VSGHTSGATQPGGSTDGRRKLPRPVGFLVLLVIAAAAGLLAAFVAAQLIHQVLVLTVGEEGIPDIDGTFIMTGLLLATYAIAIVVGLAIFAFGWIRFIRPRN
jgi:cation transporter-like permease